jgi:hypothetical protein
MTPDTILGLVDPSDPADLLMAADACEEQGAWERACWLRLRAASGRAGVDWPVGDVVVNGNPYRIVITTALESWGWSAHRAEWSRFAFDGCDYSCPAQPPPEVRHAVEATAGEAVRRVLARRNAVSGGPAGA